MEIELVTKRFVHYDDEGKITKIGHDKDENENSIEVPFDDVKALMTGKESLGSYIVEWDFLEKRNVLKHISQWENDQLKESFLYEIKNDSNADAVIQQDKKEKCWRLVLSEDVVKANIDPTLQFYSVTKKYDPNVLYRLLRFQKINNEYVVPFELDFEVDNVDLSIYTVRKFSTYSYEVIDG
tara:strand:- start:248 stop:793 length:546 start_codon:yes stop_codon:yes gene_type:complete